MSRRPAVLLSGRAKRCTLGPNGQCLSVDSAPTQDISVLCTADRRNSFGTGARGPRADQKPEAVAIELLNDEAASRRRPRTVLIGTRTEGGPRGVLDLKLDIPENVDSYPPTEGFEQNTTSPLARHLLS